MANEHRKQTWDEYKALLHGAPPREDTELRVEIFELNHDMLREIEVSDWTMALAIAETLIETIEELAGVRGYWVTDSS